MADFPEAIDASPSNETETTVKRTSATPEAGARIVSECSQIVELKLAPGARWRAAADTHKSALLDLEVMTWKPDSIEAAAAKTWNVWGWQSVVTTPSFGGPGKEKRKNLFVRKDFLPMMPVKWHQRTCLWK